MLDKSSVIIELIILAHRLESLADRYFFAPDGLSMSTGRILLCLYHQNGGTPTELTHMLGGKKSNVTQRIALLKKAGLAELIPSDHGDRRSVKIMLSESGKELAIKLEKIFDANLEELERAVTDTQKEELHTVLNLLTKKLDTFESSQT
jgi:DNA-binding MarR family transcriptional regulator